jgi:hypothetical protein
VSDPYESEDEELPPAVVHLLSTAGEPEEGALRWTPTTLVIDLFNAVGLILEGTASFFSGQARSLAARASLKEELADRALVKRIKEEERLQMQRHTLEDIAYLPEGEA